MRMQVILDSLFPARVQPLKGAGRKESSGTGLGSLLSDVHGIELRIDIFVTGGIFFL